ncbi:hypothetical protein WR25_12202 [Diploscapter pachys]|uniref:Uncharacterized protein n=1 Tax=Diploscapter pachys TaxID=2018661 RepID=A0A2A2LWN9_9BILA|nr:hypothetical protein WR25_12202 [Diploscapter pachys]
MHVHASICISVCLLALPLISLACFATVPDDEVTLPPTTSLATVTTQQVQETTTGTTQEVSTTISSTTTSTTTTTTTTTTDSCFENSAPLAECVFWCYCGQLEHSKYELHGVMLPSLNHVPPATTL